MHRTCSKVLLQFLIIACLALTASSQHLDTQGKTILTQSDTLISPLGIYKLRLLNNCSLQIQLFNEQNNQYSVSSVIEPGISGLTSCSYLNLTTANQGLMTNDGIIYRKSSIANQQYNRFKFGINDYGLVYLISFWQAGNDNQIQYIVDFLQNNINVREGPLLSNLQNSVTYTNKNNWQFDNNNGILTIKKLDATTNLNKTVNLRGYQLRETGFTDPQGETRYAAIPGMVMSPRAGLSSCASPEGVFAQFDDYWPVIRVYDREKHLLASYSVRQIKERSCPQKTFEHNGQCLSSCPKPYFKQIRGAYGYCVLRCETGSIINQQTRVCTSANYQSFSSSNLNTILNRSCPPQSYQYQFGCICQNNRFYDFNSNTCLDKCPDQSFGANGICMSCPQRCNKCGIDQTKLNYLGCTQCADGYSGSMCMISSTTCNNILHCVSCSKSDTNTQICNKCQPFYTLSSNKLICSLNCAKDELPILGPSSQSYCHRVDPSSQSSPNDYVGTAYSSNTYLLRKSGTCASNMRILRDQCVATCPEGMDMNSDRRCVCSSGMATFNNNTCYRISDLSPVSLGYYYNSTYNTYLNCPSGCIRCQYSYCLRCQPGYILVVSGSTSACRQNNIHFTCNSQYYTYDPTNSICASNALLRASTNLTNCKTQIRSRCIACRDNYYLYDTTCVSSCPSGYTISKSTSTCIKSIQDCGVSQLVSVPVPTSIDNSVIASPTYRSYSNNGVEISGEPVTEILAIREQLGIPLTLSQPLAAVMHQPRIVCRSKASSMAGNNTNTNNTIPTDILPNRCTGAVGQLQLLNGTCTSTCPNSTFQFIPSTRNAIYCIPQTACSRTNSSTPFQLQNGTCTGSCPSPSVPIQFGSSPTSIIQCTALTQCQKIDQFTPFQLVDTQCASSCPVGTSPLLRQNNRLVCSNQTSAPRPLNIDASVYTLTDYGDNVKQKLYYFVIDQLLNVSDIHVNYLTNPTTTVKPQLKVSQSLPSPSPTHTDNLHVTQVNDKTYIAIPTTADQVILDLSRNIQQFTSPNGNMLASFIYGVRANQNHIHNARSWLAIIAYVLSLILICLHSIYIGNEILYKIDNWLIFAQSLFYFSFVHLLINSSIGQFYYGFLWAHFGFFPNYFTQTIPPNYMQGYFDTPHPQHNYVPNSYRLLTGDANFIRNAGFSFSLLSTFIAGFLVVSVMIFILKKCCGKYELWYRRIAKNALIAAWEFVSMNIFYWAVAHLLYNRDRLFSAVGEEPGSHTTFRTSCSAAAITWICIYGLYMIIRFAKNKIGGLYMFKRLAFATILAASAYQQFSGGKYKLFLIPLVAAQIIFMILRFIFEKPYLKRQKIFIILQTVLMLVAYITIYLWNDTGFVSVFVSLILFLFIFLFTADLMDVFLDNKDQYYDDNVKLAPGLRHKQFTTGDEYERINGQGSIPNSERRLRNG